MNALADWLGRLERLHPSAIELGLDRVGAVRNAMRLSPGFPIITVGGTNGKGSICAFLEAILHHAGYRVGLYTSPHLLRYNERVRVGMREAEDADLVAAFERVEAARAGVSLTYFEFGTLAAVALFVDRAVDVAVMEVGLGGRLDAVNLFDPDCAVLASVALDHMAWLGDTRERIGWEKAHIFRAGRPAVCAERDPPATVRAHADSIGARLLLAGRDFDADADAVQWRYRGPGGVRGGLPPPALRGAHQVANAAAALAALDALHGRLPVEMQAVRAGLAAVRLPGRFQVLPGRPAIVLDVAHNPHAAATLADNLRAQGRFPRTIALVGVLDDKDLAGIVEAVRREVDDWFVVDLPGPRGLPARVLAEIIGRLDPAKPVREFPGPRQAVAAAREACDLDDRIVAFGSFLTVADVLEGMKTQAEGS